MKNGGQYRKGANYERKVQNMANSMPRRICIRSAGSHKLFDIVDIDFSTQTIILSQLKRNKKYFNVQKELDTIRNILSEKKIDIYENGWKLKMQLVVKKNYKEAEFYPI